ncbi:hypothetical protein ACIQU1_29650 [Streptomyces angustmyceticus]|uniref:hypothetical protein n=1 Tax=Streptomyces angustmyceticus TaxID=285578 RepID=UPI00381C368D
MPSPGSYAVDGRDGRVGLVVGQQGPLVQLRAPGGGPAWTCPPHLLRTAPPSAVLVARLRERNWESRIP